MNTKDKEPAAGVEFLMRTLELAETLLSASDSRNLDHAVFCRRAARDFLSSVARLLPHVQPAERGRGEVVAAAQRLETELQNLGS